MGRKQPIRLTLIFTVALTAFMGGLAFARIGPNVDSVWVLVAGLATGIGFFLGRKRAFLLLALPVTLFIAGWCRGEAVMTQTAVYEGLIGKTVTIEATAIDDAVYSDRGQLEFAVGQMKLYEPFTSDLVGEMDVEGSGAPIVYRGDRLLIEGRLFRKRGGQIVGTSFAKLTVISHSRSPIESIRRNFAAGMQSVLPERLASFALGLLIGQRTTLDPTLEEEMITVGLIHIVAVSGYNLTVIIEVVRRLLRRQSRFQSVLFSLVLIGVFLLFTGYAPSIVRAAIVSSISLVAWYWGRAFKPMLLLLFVAALTAGIYPLYLWSNIGWYLSFTAFFGVLVLGPLLKERFVPEKWQESLIPSVLSETIAAQLCTLPIILYIFGRLSNISILANVLVVPLTPLAMLLSLLAGLAGMFELFFSKLIALPTQVLLDYMLGVSSLLARVPYANVEVHINTQQMIALNFGIVGLVIVLRMKLRPKSAIITEIEE
jgi:competence protein ComEC